MLSGERGASILEHCRLHRAPYGPRNTIPSSPIFSELKLTDDDIAEIDFRFEGLKPYLKPRAPGLAATRWRDGG